MVSSANKYGVAEDKALGRSLTYKTKSSGHGPRILPWGTTETTGSKLERHPFTLTHCILEDR